MYAPDGGGGGEAGGSDGEEAALADLADFMGSAAFGEGRWKVDDLVEAHRQQLDRIDELSKYMTDLQGARDGQGEQLVHFPDDFSRIVEELITDKRAADPADDWLAGAAAEGEGGEGAPEYPFNFKFKDGENVDPKVRRGLENIMKYDRILTDKVKAAARMAVLMDPERAAAEKAVRQDAAVKRAEERIQAELRRRQEKARLERVLKGEDVPDRVKRALGHGDAGLMSLNAEEEALVEAVLNRDDTDENPFDFEAGEPDAAADEAAVEKLVELDAKLSEYANDHRLWDDAARPGTGSVAGTSPAKSEGGPDEDASSSRKSPSKFAGQDYLRELREEKDLMLVDREIDAKIRALKTSEVVRASEAQIAELLNQLKVDA